MALVLKDRVKETTTTTGTGTIDLAGAATGFEGFVSAVGSGNSCYYAILDANDSAWEVGTGTVTDAATDTLSRDTVLESSNSDSKVDLSAGTHTVFLTYPADKSVYRNTNDQIVVTASGIVFSDDTVQTTAPVTYTAGTGLSLSGTEFYTANTGNFQQLTFNDKVVRIGDSAGSGDISCARSEFIGDEAGKEASGVTDSQFFGSEAGSQAGNNTHISAIGSTAGSQASGCDNSQFLGRSAGSEASNCDKVVMVGYLTGANAVSSENSVIIGTEAGYESTEVTHSNLIGKLAGSESSGSYNNYIGYRAGERAEGNYNLEIVNSGASTSILHNKNNKVHIQKVIIGDSTDGKLAVGNVGASNLDPDATLEIVSANVNDTGLLVHNLIAAETGILLPSTVPAVTTNKLYNNGGALTFNGSAVNTDTNTQLTTEAVQDIAGALIASGGTKTGISVTYQDDTGDMDLEVDHDAASNFVANEHIDHTSVTLTAGSGLSGGGDISVNRTFHVSGVDTSLLQGTIGSAQIANDAIDSQHYTDGSIDNAHLADDAVGIAELSATGTASESKYLAGNNSWKTASFGLTASNGGTASLLPGSIPLYGTANEVTVLFNGSTGFVWGLPDDVTITGDLNVGTIASGTWQGTAIAHDYIGADAIDGDNIADDSVDSEHYVDGSIDTAHIGDDQVTADKLANSINTDIATGVTANTTANAALPKTGGAMTGAITTNSTFDGVDIATRDAVLTSTTTTANAALPKAGGTMTGTLTVGVDGTGKDVKLYGDTAGSYLEWDESEDRLNLVGAAYVNEAVPANDTPTTEDANVILDLSLGNYHNIVLGASNVNQFQFTNAKRGQKFILRITQHASSAKTVGWTNVDSHTDGTAANLKWAGNITPTMSTTVSHKDVYGFICTSGTAGFDGFIIGQDIPE